MIEAMIRTFRAGDIESLTAKSPIIFTGLLIERRRDGAITLSKTHNADELKKIAPTDFINNNNNEIKDTGKLRTSIRQALGSLIWLHQTRPDVGYDVTRIATEAVAACATATLALQSIALYNKTVRSVQTYARKIAYAAPPDASSTLRDRLRQLKNRRLILFTDAGF